MAGAFDIFVAYKFIKILSTPWIKTDAYKLGIIDENGGLLKKRKDLKTGDEKKAYTIIHTLVWNIKRLLDKLPPTKTKFGSFAVALWLLKEKQVVKESTIYEDAFLSYIGVNKMDLEFGNIMEDDGSHKRNIEAKSYKATKPASVVYDFVNLHDEIVVENGDCSDTVLGIPLFTGRHKPTGKKVVISYEDIR